MNGSEVKQMTDEVLDTEIRKLREQLHRLRTQTVTEKVADTSLFRKVKRDIARCLTEKRARAGSPAR